MQRKIIELLPIDSLYQTACVSKAFRDGFIEQRELLCSSIPTFAQEGPVTVPMYEEALPNFGGLDAPPASMVKGLLQAWDSTCTELGSPGFFGKCRYQADLDGSVHRRDYGGMVRLKG